ncbi:MAG: hypothetical protein EOO65_06105, partial [Methanosarcinales archaeon]
DWTIRTHLKVGGVLLNLLLKSAMVEVQADGRLVYEREDPTAASKPISELSRTLQTYFLQDKTPSSRAAAASGASHDPLLSTGPEEMLGMAGSRDMADDEEDEEGDLAHANYGSDAEESDSEVAACNQLRAAQAAARGMDIGADASVDVSTGVLRQWDDVAHRERMMVPSFKHVYSRMQLKTAGMIACHPRIIELLTDSAVKYAHPTHFPMIVPPRPWNAPNSGGYLKQRVPIVRVAPGTRMQLELMRTANMPRLFDALSILGKTPWRINTFVESVVQKVWELVVADLNRL